MRPSLGIGSTGGASGYGKRMISSRKARRLMAQGWNAADLHVHTRFSYDVIADTSVDPRFLYQKGRDAGMSFVTFTDHDTMAAYDCIGWERPDLVPWVEVKILDRVRVGHTIHINVYLLDHRQFREIERIARQVQVELLLTYLKDNDLPYTYNHPFWFEFGEQPNLKMVPQLFELFPVVEYNMHRVRRMNRLTLELA